MHTLQDNYTSTLVQDFGFLLLQLPRSQIAKSVLCFVLVLKFPDIAVAIEGTVDLTDGTDTVSDVNVMLSTATVTSQYMPENNKTLIVALTLCLMFIVLITIIIISLIIVIVKRRRKWHSTLSNPLSNIYE